MQGGCHQLDSLPQNSKSQRKERASLVQKLEQQAGYNSYWSSLNHVSIPSPISVVRSMWYSAGRGLNCLFDLEWGGMADLQSSWARERQPQTPDAHCSEPFLLGLVKGVWLYAPGGWYLYCFLLSFPIVPEYVLWKHPFFWVQMVVAEFLS